MTIAQLLNIKVFPYEIYENGNLVYHENWKGFWTKRKYDANGKEIYYEDSDGFWVKYKYNSNGNPIYYENSNGDWIKWEWDSEGCRIYYEDSDGTIYDKRTNNDRLSFEDGTPANNDRPE